MSDHPQQAAAAAKSARARQARKLERQLTSARPLTAEQRNSIIAAAIAIPVVSSDLPRSA